MEGVTAVESQVFYADRLVRITDESILFRWYYFPFVPKRVLFSAVDHIEAYTPSIWTGKYRIWGTGDFRTWCPFDLYRPIRDTIFIMSLTNQATRIGFTVEHSEIVRSLFQERYLLAQTMAP